jgi:NAD(P)-dependent dehydrogenase (short-subunit alcohol dehydrogenase family)
VFLTGRSLASAESVVKDIVSAGGSAEAAEVHAIGIPNPKTRVPLVELDVEQFSLPIATYTRSYFLTARVAARRMIPNNSGVIMTVTATRSANGYSIGRGRGPQPWPL